MLYCVRWYVSPGRIGPTILSALTGGMASAISNNGMYLPQRVIY